MPGMRYLTLPQRISAAWLGPTVHFTSPSGRFFTMSKSVRAATATEPPAVTCASESAETPR